MVQKTINPLRRFKKGSILMHIFHHATNEFYGSWIKEELANHGYKISDGTLYPWLSRLTFSGYLKVDERNVAGKIRKYYSITKAGEEHFKEMQLVLKKLYEEILM